MANMNKRLEKLERGLPSPAAEPVDGAELAERLIAEFANLQAQGYITQDGEVSPDCPLGQRRSMAILGSLFLKGELWET